LGAALVTVEIGAKFRLGYEIGDLGLWTGISGLTNEEHSCGF